MFKRRTLFVIGAGASREAGLPCGDDLALQISGKLDVRYDDRGALSGSGDRALFDAVLRIVGTDRQSQLLEASWLIRDGIHLSHSVDDFLDRHRDNQDLVLLGKAAIAKCILDAERESTLWYDDSNEYNTIDYRNLHATWYAKFMKVLSKNVHRDNVSEIFDNVAFVVFNYDRCLEHFLSHALERLYGIDAAQAKVICDDATIIHPYGSVAPLRRGSGGGVLFGANRVNAAELAANIRTYTEQVLEADTLNGIRNEVARAQAIIFLGCAFHDPNMLMLTPAEPVKSVPVFASGYGISDDDKDHVAAAIGALFKGGRTESIRQRTNMKCADLFDSFSRTIAG